VIRRPRPAAHYRAEDIPTLATHVRYAATCRLAHETAVKQLESGEISLPEAVVRLRGEYQRAWRRPRGATCIG
jgi:hypothetical protein